MINGLALLTQVSTWYIGCFRCDSCWHVFILCNV